jgi:hypothetical protein
MPQPPAQLCEPAQMTLRRVTNPLNQQFGLALRWGFKNILGLFGCAFISRTIPQQVPSQAYVAPAVNVRF